MSEKGGTTRALLSTIEGAIVRVGKGGRGFLVEDARGECYVLTAAHCLPRLPRMRPWEDVPYKAILGPFGRRRPTVWAQCIFVDPISDLALLAEADNQTYSAEAEKFSTLTDERPKIQIASLVQSGPGWILGLNRSWEAIALTVDSLNRWRTIAFDDPPPNAIACGTSGSPILDATGAAVGVMSLGQEGNPRLALELPVWVLGRLKGGV